jgi:hypothetical protein
MKRKRLLMLLPLVGIIAIIWSLNFNNLGIICKHSDDVRSLSIDSLVSSDSLYGDHFVFENLDHDPFALLPDTMPEEPIMPTLSLKGIVLARGDALALMELPDGNVRPLRKGEEYLGVWIREITAKHVTVIFDGKAHVYSVQP